MKKKSTLISVLLAPLLFSCGTQLVNNQSKIQCASDNWQDKGTFNCTLILKKGANPADVDFKDVESGTCSVIVTWGDGKVSRKSSRNLKQVYEWAAYASSVLNIPDTHSTSKGKTYLRLYGTRELPRSRGGCGIALEGFE